MSGRIAINEDNTSAIFIQAIEGIYTGSNLKIRGLLEGHHILILLESGSSHLLFDENAIKRSRISC